LNWQSDTFPLLQEQLLIPHLWSAGLNSNFCHLSAEAVPLIVHAMGLPHGIEQYWSLVNDAFTATDWTKRFEGVEKVGLFHWPSGDNASPILSQGRWQCKAITVLR
jgi:hypothetical protein